MNPPLTSKAEPRTAEMLPCPGKLLRDAREAQKMTVATVAKQLRLSSVLVDALEAEDFDKLPARVFVRGYYNKYARLLDIPEIKIMREFEGRCPDDECQASLPKVPGVKSQLHSGHGIMKAITWIIVLAFLGMLGYWGRGYITSKYNTLSEPSSATDGLASELISQQRPVAISPQPVAIEVEPQVKPASLNTQNLQQDAPIKTALEPVPQPAPEPPVKPVFASNQQAEIVVSFIGECWVDIRDSSRKFKLFGTMRAGDSRKLEGKAPYKIVLGNYKSVNISVGGKTYDLAAHAVGLTAKFTLDPARL